MTDYRIVYAMSPTLEAFHTCDAFYRGVMGPVGSGKSTACCQEILRRAGQQAPGEDGIRRSRWAVVRNSERELRDTALKTWLDWFPEERFGRFHRTDMRHVIEMGDLCLEVLFRALDRPGDVKKLLSLELTGAWVNEAREVPKSIIDALGDRVERFPSVRDGGCTWAGVIMDTNPPDTDHWWHRLAEEERPEDWAFFNQPGGLVEKDGEFLPNPLAENMENLPPDYYLKRISGKSAEYVRVYYCAKYGFVCDGRPVYPEYADNLHVLRTPFEPVKERKVHIGVDFGLTPAAIFGQRDSLGRWVLFHELVTEDMGVTRFSELLKLRMRERCPGFEFRVTGDPAGVQRAQTDERTPFEIMKKAGIKARPAETNDFTLRREAVAVALSRLVEGRPGLVVTPDCPVLRKGMAGGYAFRRVQVAGDERFRDAPDKTKHSHVCEALQYLMLGAGEGRMVRGRGGKAKARPAGTTTQVNEHGWMG